MHKEVLIKLSILNRIEKLRKERGITQKYLAEKLGTSRFKFADVRRGQSSFSKDELEIIAEELSTTVEYIKGESDTKKPAEKIDGFVPTKAEKDFIINVYRKLSPEQQEAFRTILRKEK